MLREAIALFSLFATVIARAQVPFTNTDDRTEAQWSLDNLPDPNGTDHLVFETVHSLLQQWPNTRMRNGHNIVPGQIPKGTLLYHETWRNELPPGPEWVATDPEHSYYFCTGSRADSEHCWLLTLVATRPLKVIYFDGNSAAKIPYGTTDTQDLLISGRSHSQTPFDDLRRIQDLCAWGEGFGVDGFVRMEMDFEVMLCNFTSGVRVVSFLSLVKQKESKLTKLDHLSFEVYYSGSLHNHFPGETRVQLDLPGLVSFYDTKLAPSLTDIRAGQERWDHRVQNVSHEDLSAAKSRLEASLVRPDGQSSGYDWRTLIQVIVDRYAGRLELTRHLLNSSTTESDEIVDLARKTQTQLRIMLTPYLLLSVIQTGPSDERGANWTVPIYKHCATTHTYAMSPDSDSMTDSEKLLLQAVRGTTREICRVVTKMWTAGVYAGIDPLLNTMESPDIAAVAHLWNTWTEELGNLMAWLDWSVWIKCTPSCDLEEMCYLPTWPDGFPESRRWPPPPDSDGPPLENISSFNIRAMAMQRLAEEMGRIVESGPDDWIRPQPRCVRRVDPYEL